jgi:hypothetical protein
MIDEIPKRRYGAGCGWKSRRELLCSVSGAGLALLSGSGDKAMLANENLTTARDAIDHLLLGTPDLDLGIRLVKAQTGLSPVPGGSHPGVGTWNALLPMGSQYLEIIAPDPAQTVFSYSIDLRKLKKPSLVAWAALSKDMNGTVGIAKAAGLTLMGPAEGSRVRPDGKTLNWRKLSIKNTLAGPIIDPVPFFIEWGRGVPHPSKDAPTSCRIESLRFEHPEPAKLMDLLQKLGLKAEVDRAGEPRLIASLHTPMGRWVLK